MSGMAKALTVFASPNAAAERQMMQSLLADMLDAAGCVRFKSVVSCHDHLVRRYGFTLVRNVTWGVRPGGRHLFFQQGHVLLRIKTSGTPMRTEPHMTISVTDGLEWPDEVAKLSRHGDLIPKQGGVNRADFRSLMRLGPDAAAIFAVDDAWADACHFNFTSGFDGSGAPGLPAKKK
jgi:hypothetical protein